MNIATNAPAHITREELAELAGQVAGPVLRPDDAGFADESAAWNLAATLRPAVAVGATRVGDVQAAVRFAAAHDLPVALLSTGHGAFVPADGAVLINLRRMTGISIDAAARTATVAAAVQAQHLVDAAAEVGLAPLAGSSPNVGVVGYVLGGGLSPTLGRRYGYAADHVRAIELVTADGEVRHLDAVNEPDLFWAVRGGKGNFGVVTSMTLDLVPVTRLYGGGLFFGGEHVDAVLQAYRLLVADAPEELTASFAFLRLPPLPFVPEPLRGVFALHVRIAYLGEADDGAALVQGLRAAAPPLIDAVGEMPFTAFAGIHADPVDPVPAYETSSLLSGFPGEALEALLAVAGPQVESPAVMVELRQLGGALGRDPEVPNAVGQRDAAFLLQAVAMGAPGMGAAFRAPLEAIKGALAPWATGGKQVNFLGAYDTEPGAVAAAYAPQTYRRLQEVKAGHDPHDLFRIDYSIPPRPDAQPTGTPA